MTELGMPPSKDKFHTFDSLFSNLIGCSIKFNQLTVSKQVSSSECVTIHHNSEKLVMAFRTTFVSFYLIASAKIEADSTSTEP